MSECKGLRCDRCGVRTLAPEQDHCLPEGWTVVKALRGKPYYDTQKDLCPACTVLVLAVLLGEVHYEV